MINEKTEFINLQGYKEGDEIEINGVKYRVHVKNIDAEDEEKRPRMWKWTTPRSGFKDSYNAYPIYSCHTPDIYRYFAMTGCSYNQAYDVMNMAGMPWTTNRINELTSEESQHALKLVKAIDPDNWSTMVNRLHGIKAINTVGTANIMDYFAMKLPKDHTWESYLKFLMEHTIPKASAEMHESHFRRYITHWLNIGAPISQEEFDRYDAIHPGNIFNTHKYSSFSHNRLCYAAHKIEDDYKAELDLKEFNGVRVEGRHDFKAGDPHPEKWDRLGITEEMWLKEPAIMTKWVDLDRGSQAPSWRKLATEVLTNDLLGLKIGFSISAHYKELQTKLIADARAKRKEQEAEAKQKAEGK